MLTLIADIYLGFILFCLLLGMIWVIDFILFDNLFANKLKRWVENKFGDDCNKDCNQGRNCCCKCTHMKTK